MRWLALAVALGTGAPLLAEDAPALADDGRRTTGRLLRNVGRASLGVFSSESLKPLVMGGLATGYVSAFDAEVRDEVADPESDYGRRVGAATSGVVTAVVSSALFVAGRRSHSPRFRAFSYDLPPAMAVTFGYTALLKGAVGRERPNGEDHKSFPSGHSSNAFAVATVIERHYGRKGALVAYPLAAFVGFTRIQQNKHYLSDVAAGATLGIIVGRTVVRVNGQAPGASRGAELSVAPLVSRGARGLRLSLVF